MVRICSIETTLFINGFLGWQRTSINYQDQFHSIFIAHTLTVTNDVVSTLGHCHLCLNTWTNCCRLHVLILWFPCRRKLIKVNPLDKFIIILLALVPLLLMRIAVFLILFLLMLVFLFADLKLIFGQGLHITSENSLVKPTHGVHCRSQATIIFK